jgi:hypothetical protein
MNNVFDYYRIKTKWTSERPDGSLEKVKSEDLVRASSYTEAEKAAYLLVEHLRRNQYDYRISVEIVKTKIDELFYRPVLSTETEMVGGFVSNYFKKGDDTEAGLYAVKVMYLELNEKTGMEKHSTGTIHVPGESSVDASNFVKHFLKKYESRDFIIRDIKFDNAESILWPPDIHREKIESYKRG